MDNKIWVPERVYERVPQLWFLMGILFIAFGSYIGFNFNLIYVYLALGAICIGRAIWCMQARRHHRSDEESSDDSSSDEGHRSS